MEYLDLIWVGRKSGCYTGSIVHGAVISSGSPSRRREMFANNISEKLFANHFCMNKSYFREMFANRFCWSHFLDTGVWQ
ncbi:hypothetical protein Patl1_05382 [Pistacia atlantica]|uniref:Uncharacterized protein n=1 Tax=Pistacia atlantica TaxID=434234 RepID=A0ACC1BRB9_9ROSI|nr:hypothetical protein Patl1_05382 [Pistacia atlantica]